MHEKFEIQHDFFLSQKFVNFELSIGNIQHFVQNLKWTVGCMPAWLCRNWDWQTEYF